MTSPSDEPITLCTSIAPGRLDLQRACISSWLNAGFRMISVNAVQEIHSLRGSFPEVTFYPLERCGAPPWGEPTPFIRDAIQALAHEGGRHLGLVNSDTFLCRPELAGDLRLRDERTLVLGQRVDVDPLLGGSPHREECGIDLFVFGRSLVDLFDEAPFDFGLPWRDYWVLFTAAFGGIPVTRLTRDELLHVRHPARASHRAWERGAEEFAAFVRWQHARTPPRPHDQNARQAIDRFGTAPTVGEAALGYAFSSVVRDFVTHCPAFVAPSPPRARVTIRESMGLTFDRLFPGVSSHNNHVRPFCAVPAFLWGKPFTQVVACRVSPVEVEFQTSGTLYVLAGTDWEGGREMASLLATIGRKEPLPPLETAMGSSFEVFSLTREAGEHVVIPTQVMVVAEGLSRPDGHVTTRSRLPSARANPYRRVLLIAARKRCGSFSMFFQVLGLLAWAEAEGLTPVVYFNRHVCYWSETGHNGSRNAWEYFFRPVSGVNAEHVLGDLTEVEGLDASRIARRVADRAVVRNDYLAHDTGYAGRIDARQRAACARLVQRYIRLRPEIAMAVDDFHVRHLRGSHVVGVHYRGTDKVAEAAPPPFELYRRELDAHIVTRPALRIFAATDCARFLDELERVYGERVVCTGARRSRDGQPTHYGYTRGAEEVLIDAVLLSRCDHFVHGVSNVSAAVLVLNPMLEHTDLEEISMAAEPT